MSPRNASGGCGASDVAFVLGQDVLDVARLEFVDEQLPRFRQRQLLREHSQDGIGAAEAHRRRGSSRFRPVSRWLHPFMTGD